MKLLFRYIRRSLWLNKMRTFITICGIILSVALFTGVTTCVSTFRQYLLDVEAENNGEYYISYLDIGKEDWNQVTRDDEVSLFADMQNIGFLQSDKELGGKYLGAYAGDFFKLMHVHVTEGREPKDSSEIMVAEYDIRKHKVGDEITLSLGLKKEDGQTLWLTEAGEGQETFVPMLEKKVRIVGTYSAASLGIYSGVPGYPLLTRSDKALSTELAQISDEEEPTYAGFVTLRHAKDATAFSQKYKKGIVEVNSRYLSFLGYAPNNEYRKAMYQMMAVLIAIIMVGSVSLIYNSFSISVGERRKQYGIFSSVGASRKQLRRSVFYEAAVLGCIGIPIGIVCGLAGLKVTFWALQDVFARFMGNYVVATIEMRTSLMAIVAAVLVSMATLILSAWIPARKAVQVSAIEAIRQSDEVRINPRSVRTSKLTRRLFRVEGVIASKNYKRNRRKYRATVFSIFISIILYLASTSFCNILEISLEEVTQSYLSDIGITDFDNPKDQYFEEMYRLFSGKKGVTDSSILYSKGGIMIENPEIMTKDYLEAKSYGYLTEIGEVAEDNVEPVFVEDEKYEEWLRKNGYDPDIYMNTSSPTALVFDRVTMETRDDGKVKTIDVFDKEKFDLSLYFLESDKLPEGYGYAYPVNGEGGRLEAKLESENTDEEKRVPMETVYQEVKIHVGACERTKRPPIGVSMITDTSRYSIVFPMGAWSSIFGEGQEPEEKAMAFNAEEPDELYRDIEAYKKKNGYTSMYIHNYFDEMMSSKALMTVIRVFSYGFIVLLSLIAVANVFNTISTNVILRRREYAMLRSIGMSRKGFFRMSGFECLLYGFWGILLGVPVGTGIHFLILNLMQNIAHVFYLPWLNVLIAMITVLAVVSITMFYAMFKIRKYNVVETLRQE